MRLASVAVVLLILATATVARGEQTVIDFESLRLENGSGNDIGTSYEEGGFSFVLDVEPYLLEPPYNLHLEVLGTLHERFSGSTALYAYAGGEFISMTALDGRAFSLTSIDLTELGGPDGPQEFIGVFSNGDTISQTCYMNGFDFLPQTFFFEGFEDIIELRWGQFSPGCQVDNITILTTTIPAAGRTVIDFESLRVEDDLTYEIGGVYYEDGFVLTSEKSEEYGFKTAGALAPQFFGSTGLWNRDGNVGQVLTAQGGIAFDLIAIDLGGFTGGEDPEGWPPFEITFYGTRTDDSVASQTISVSNYLTFETYTFSGFTHLMSLSWSQGHGVPGIHQFDNITLETGVVPAVSARGLAMFALAIVAAGAVEIRRQRRVA